MLLKTPLWLPHEEPPSMLEALELTRRIFTSGTRRRPSAPGFSREISRASAERVEPVGDVDMLWLRLRELRDSELRLKEAEN